MTFFVNIAWVFFLAAAGGYFAWRSWKKTGKVSPHYAAWVAAAVLLLVSTVYQQSRPYTPKGTIYRSPDPVNNVDDRLGTPQSVAPVHLTTEEYEARRRARFHPDSPVNQARDVESQ